VVTSTQTAFPKYGMGQVVAPTWNLKGTAGHSHSGPNNKHLLANLPPPDSKFKPQPVVQQPCANQVKPDSIKLSWDRT